ncbi:MAG: CHASE2 domain-containing protein [Bryobacterales bacterium]|nr:CHASE2 domain-containing protein [Bryobacterales bacterium]
MVAIDDQTAARYGPLPLNRARLAEGLEVLAQARPRVVVLDLLLSEPGDPSQDARLPARSAFSPRCLGRGPEKGDAGENPRWILPLPELAQGRSTAHVTRHPTRMVTCAPFCS